MYDNANMPGPNVNYKQGFANEKPKHEQVIDFSPSSSLVMSLDCKTKLILSRIHINYLSITSYL